MNRDEELDNFIRSKIKGNRADHFIEPSEDFARRTMAKIYRIEKGKRYAVYLFAVVLSLFPLLAREFWMMVRGDYFSVARLPFGNVIARAYGFFISPVALYLFLLAGVGVSIYYILKLKKADSFVRIA